MEVKKIKKLSKIMLILVSSFIVLCVCRTVNGNVEYEYVLKSLGLNGYNESGITPVIMELQDRNGNRINAYCADMTTPVINGSGYNCKPIKKCNNFSEETINHLEVILKNAYPFIGISELQERSGIKYIKKKEAITAVQYAIWHYTNNIEPYSEYKVVNDLYKWFIDLQPLKSDENSPYKVYLAINNDIDTQILIGIKEFNSNDIVSSDGEEITTPENKNTISSSEENSTSVKKETVSKEEGRTSAAYTLMAEEETDVLTESLKSSEKERNVYVYNEMKIENEECDEESPETGDSVKSIIVTIILGISMVIILFLLKGKKKI